MNVSAEVTEILADLRRRFEQRYGERLAALVLYGSQARGDAGPASDVDVLVVLDGPVDPGLEVARTEFDVADVSLAHDAAIVCLFVSREQFEEERSPLLINVRREGIVV